MLKNSRSDIQENISEEQAIAACDLQAAMAMTIQHFFERNGESRAYLPEKTTFVRLEIPTHSLDPIRWLAAQKDAGKTYWCGRERSQTFGIEMAGLGSADILSATDAFSYDAVFDEIRARLVGSHKNLRYYGGFRFYDGREVDASWEAFGSYRFIVPRWEIQRSGAKATFCCNIKIEPHTENAELCRHLLDELRTLDFSEIESDTFYPHFVKRSDLPDHRRWRKMIDNALTALHRGALDKVVLARITRFVFDEKLEPLALLARLKNSAPNLFYFYFQPQQHVAFLGGSPERLYSRENRMLKSEAIAGTRPRGETAQADRSLANELLRCDKDLREHRFVVENIKENLEKLCHTVDIDDETTILKLAQIQHLRCRLQGVLADDVSEADILKTLHPTPAVGGSPTQKAIAAIKELEPFDRGWYAAPLGWISQHASEFVVGIRSGLVDHETLALYSGAGIVKGSTPEGEWSEIETKIASFMKAILRK